LEAGKQTYSICKKGKAKALYFYLQALSAKVWSPKGRRGKEKHFTCEATGGI